MNISYWFPLPKFELLLLLSLSKCHVLPSAVVEFNFLSNSPKKLGNKARQDKAEVKGRDATCLRGRQVPDMFTCSIRCWCAFFSISWILAIAQGCHLPRRVQVMAAGFIDLPHPTTPPTRALILSHYAKFRVKWHDSPKTSNSSPNANCPNRSALMRVQVHG